MIDLTDFYTRLGVPRSPGQDEQLIFPGQVRVQVTATDWTAIFESVQVDAAVLNALLDLSRQPGAAVPFLTRSGYLGMKWQSLTPLPDTSDALQALQAVLRQVAAA